MGEHKSWAQGRFIDSRKYDRMGDDWKDGARRREAKLVRPSPTANSICHCERPEDAVWIAGRLNLAAKLEAVAKEAKDLLDYAIHHDGRYEQCANRDFQNSAHQTSEKIAQLLPAAPLLGEEQCSTED